MQYEDFSNSNERLDRLFEAYRHACEAPELSAGFMPALWQKIEARQSTSWVFNRISGWFVAASAAAAAVLALALLSMPGGTGNYAATYVDALAAEHTAEYINYIEPIRGVKVVDYSAGGILE
jgi:anti-sigma-K factor RskA